MNLTNYKNYQETQFDNCQNCSPNLDHNLHFLFYLDTFLCSRGVAVVLLSSFCSLAVVLLCLAGVQVV